MCTCSTARLHLCQLAAASSRDRGAGRQSSANNALVSCSVPWTKRRSKGMRCDTHRSMHKGRAMRIHRVTQRSHRGCKLKSLRGLDVSKPSTIQPCKTVEPSRPCIRCIRCNANIAAQKCWSRRSQLIAVVDARPGSCCPTSSLHYCRQRAIAPGSSRHITLAPWPC
jgi:hypothetical protein